MNERSRHGRRSALAIGIINAMLTPPMGHAVFDPAATRERVKKHGGAFGSGYRYRKPRTGRKRTLFSAPLARDYRQPGDDPLRHQDGRKTGTKHKGTRPVRPLPSKRKPVLSRERISKKGRIRLRDLEKPYRCDECGSKNSAPGMVVAGPGMTMLRYCEPCNLRVMQP